MTTSVARACVRTIHATSSGLAARRCCIAQRRYSTTWPLELLPENGFRARMRIWPWSIAGQESAVTVEVDGLRLTFDLGYATRESLESKYVFISHGHMDHIAAVAQHARKQLLSGYARSTYFTQPELIPQLQDMLKASCAMHGDPWLQTCHISVQPISPGEHLQLDQHLSIKAFQTMHRVRSQGYIVYKTLAPGVQRKNSPSKQLAHDTTTCSRDVPIMAYTGDTIFELFKIPPMRDLLHVDLLITESTYIEDPMSNDYIDAWTRARRWGHICLGEISKNAHLFDHVKLLLLVHISDKYPLETVKTRAVEMLPDILKSRVVFGTMAQDLLQNTRE